MDINKICPGCMREVENREGISKCPRCGYDFRAMSNENHQIQPFTILNGKYLVGKVLGEGGFGITYLGFDLNLEITIAIKEFYPNGFVSREANHTSTVTAYAGKNVEEFGKWRENFLKEARSLAKFSNLSGIVEVRDFFAENNTVYIVMEYVEGITLKDYLKENGGKLPTNQVLQLMQPVIQSLGKVHATGIIHRDISPDNIMILHSGGMKLLDFGAARDISSNAEKSLSVLLKPGYAPEEQYRTRGNQGPWSDVYALCATIYKCVTGITPIESMERLRNDELEMPGALGIPIQPNEEEALKQGMAVYAENRFQTMETLYTALYQNTNFQSTPLNSTMGASAAPPRPDPHTGTGAVATPQKKEKSISIPGPQKKEKSIAIPSPQKVREQLLPGTQPSADNPNKNKMIFGIGGGIALLMVIMLAVGLGSSEKAEKTDSANSNEQEVAVEATVAATDTDGDAALQQADALVEEAAAQVGDANTCLDAQTKLKEAISQYQQVGSINEAYKKMAQQGIDNALVSYSEATITLVSIMWNQEPSMANYEQIQLYLENTKQYGEEISAAGYTVDLAVINSQEDGLQEGYREKYIEAFDKCSNQPEWYVSDNGALIDGALQLFPSEDADDLIRVRFAYALGRVVYRDIEQDASISAAAAVDKIVNSLQETDYCEWLIQYGESIASASGEAWVNYDYFEPLAIGRGEILKGSDSQEYSVSDIRNYNFNAAELRYARLEIYARHGMTVADGGINAYFANIYSPADNYVCSKYMPYNDPTTNTLYGNNGLNTTERHNIRNIMQVAIEEGKFLTY